MTDSDKPDDQTAKMGRKAKTRNARAKTWLQENKSAIDEHNERADRRGMYNDGLRRF